ncbi:4085_t:CDS:2 [Paraglomus brasilianum]|uniref:4085_t:CDS:1 n=1 Tax=Paraglomus brasilianum TaxID=144538 RepID=A0A9N9BLB5_9GLOM|nr:4085_t:CDS:2 [Paraglomus brasilianum]
MPRKQKPSRAKKSSSTTLQLAPPSWLNSLFSHFRSTGPIHLPTSSDSSSSSQSCISKIISAPYLLPKLLYVFLYGGMGAALPFLPIFYKNSLNLSSSQIGIIFSIAPFIAAISCPLWTGLADKFQAHKAIMLVTYVAAVASIVAQMLLPRVDVAENDDQWNEQDSSESSGRGSIMAWVLFAASWFAFFGIPVNALVDSGVLKILGDKKELYGEQRLWGSVSYGLCTFFVGILISASSIDAVFILFYISAIFFGLSVLFTDFNSASASNPTSRPLSTYSYRAPTAFKPLIDIDDSDNDAGRSSHKPSSAVMVLITNPSVATLLVTMLLMGTAMAICNAFLLIFLSEDLKASSTVLGLTGPMSAITELLFFFYSKDLISRFGIAQLIMFAHIATILRAITYIFLQPNSFSHVVALLVQSLNGMAFTSLWASGVTHLTNLSPPNLVSFSQGMMMAAFAGIGTGLGGLAGGLIYDNLGARAMFGAVIFITIISLIIYCWGDGIQLARTSSNNAPWNLVEGSSDDQRQISGVRTILSVETVQNKKKPHRLLSWSDDDDDDEYRYA